MLKLVGRLTEFLFVFTFGTPHGRSVGTRSLRSARNFFLLFYRSIEWFSVVSKRIEIRGNMSGYTSFARSKYTSRHYDEPNVTKITINGVDADKLKTNVCDDYRGDTRKVWNYRPGVSATTGDVRTGLSSVCLKRWKL